ncbi:MAG: methylmalonyl Co-A mutase-associated GTPase MeaB [Aureispira sp.]|nr:methylmalonyl Co-A mutase-associated GTPase MeaB [Aureispira sp.]
MKKKDPKALHIQKGVVSPSSINPNLSKKRWKRKQRSVEEYVKGIKEGNRVVLSQAITLIESQRSSHQELAEQIIEQCLPFAVPSIRIGITGTPGVGKSTFIEAFGQEIVNQGHKLAVLAIDPSSQVNQGSILGDKTRMQELSVHPSVFIRPSPAGDSLGGVARKTRESIALCEAAGYDVILVETVGVGQSEVAVHSMVDFFLLLLLPNSGDELQGIKRGIMEMADLIAINKADGNALNSAKIARKQCANALHLFPPKTSGWIAQSKICSALTKVGIPEIWESIQQYNQQTTQNGYYESHRAAQAEYWLHESIVYQLKERFFKHPHIQEKLHEIEGQVKEGSLSPFKGSELLLKLFFDK